jgi:hypothetical protein
LALTDESVALKYLRLQYSGHIVGNEILQYFNKHAAFEKTSNRPRKAGWLNGVSLLAWSVVAGFPAHAAAQTISASQGTVNSTGADITIEQNVVITGTPGVANTNVDTGTISSEGTINAAGSQGINNDASTGSNIATIGALTNGTFGSISGKTGINNTGGTSISNNTAIIGTLTNNGNITATYQAYRNQNASLGLFVNNGTVSSAGTGLYNYGVVETLTNMGTIQALVGAAIFNSGLSLTNTGGNLIATLTNSGTISSVLSYGIDNSAADTTIGTLTNSAGGLIIGRNTAILNLGTINTLTNSGLISLNSTGSAAIYNDGGSSTIGILTNHLTGTIAGHATGIANGGTIGTLTNNGLISAGSSYGIQSAGSIGVLTNGGVISSYTGIFNSGTVGNLINSGTISGAGTFGIYNETVTGMIATLTNLASGMITGYNTAIQNYGAIGTLTNSGLISETTAVGILNGATGTIGILYNAAGGTIAGQTSGVDNIGDIGILNNIAGGIIRGVTSGVYNAAGTIGVLANSGTITAGSTGINNSSGTIGTLTNTGVITGANYGISSDGTIGTIINGGTIAGLTGIGLATGGTTIINGGTITSTNDGDAVLFGGVDTLILTTGAALFGTIDGGGTASQIVLDDTGELDNTIVGFGAGGALAVTSGADWTGTGSWTVATVTNDGVFQGGNLGTPLNLTGDFLQNADGTLRVLVTPTTSTAFNVSGTATLAGTVSYLLAPGSYTPHVYPYLTAATVVGAFTTINYGVIPAGDATTQQRADPTVNLVITAPFIVAAAVPAGPAVTPVALIIGPDDSAIFSAQAQALAQSANADTASLLGKAVNGGAAASPACAAEAPLSPGRTSAYGASTTAQLASTLAGAFCGAGGWVEATGALNEANASGAAPSYHANTGGFLAGIDKIIGAFGTRIGIAFGYDKTQLTDKQGGSGGMGTTRAALYAAQPLGRFTLAGVIAYGNAADSTSRATGIGNLGENNTVNVFSGGVQLSTDITVQQIDLAPAAGLRVAQVGGGAHFAESAIGIAAAFAVHGKTAQYTSVQPYAMVAARRNFVTASGITVTPDALIGFEYEAGSRGVVTTLTGADGTVFLSPHNRLDAADALLSAGISAGRDNWSLFIDYTARIAGNWNSQTAEGGLAVRF